MWNKTKQVQTNQMEDKSSTYYGSNCKTQCLSPIKLKTTYVGTFLKTKLIYQLLI